MPVTSGGGRSGSSRPVALGLWQKMLEGARMSVWSHAARVQYTARQRPTPFSVRPASSRVPLCALVAAVGCSVHGWIIGDSTATFVPSSSESTVCVPPTCREAISVAGAVDAKSPWSGSWMGPRAIYRSEAALECPSMAHRVSPSTIHPFAEARTSFASPRACAETISVLPTAA
jgi:hypothetical protein